MIDVIDRKLLHTLEQDARITDTQLGKLVRRSSESVRQRIRKLESERIITGYTCWIDPTRLSLHSYKMYLKLSNIPKRRAELISQLLHEPRVFWLGTADGAWELGLTFFAQSNQEFYTLEQELLTKFGDVIHGKQTGMLSHVIVHSKDFLAPGKKSTAHMFSHPANLKLDEISHAIIAILLNDARASLTAIAAQARTSIDIVRGRMRLLERDGIIVRYSAAINYARLNLEFYKAFLYLRRLPKAEELRLFEFVAQHPNIVHLVQQISPWSLELEILVESYREYNAIINALKEEFADIIADVESAIINEDHVFPAGESMLKSTS